MKFTIHDVGHGFCAHLYHNNGNVMLWDWGHKTNPDYRPSNFLLVAGIRTIHRFFITNFDEDHISDLPNLQNEVAIIILHRNPTITPAQLKALKENSGPISTAISSLLSMLNTYTGDVLNPPNFPDVIFETFFCSYPVEFQDTNNLSSVTFLETPMGNFVIPGDIEKAGREHFLQKSNFRNKLTKTNVFIASHHGRTNGYCKQAFDYCRPSVVVFSDGSKKYATQEETNRYAAHASGVNFNGRTRRVLTTRLDGPLSWNSRQ